MQAGAAPTFDRDVVVQELIHELRPAPGAGGASARPSHSRAAADEMDSHHAWNGYRYEAA